MFAMVNVLKMLSYVMLFLMLLLIVFSYKKRKEIGNWGGRLLFLWMFGLVLCMVVAMRDNYHLSVMATNDQLIEPGVFTVDSIQSNLCVLLGLVNVLSLVTGLVIRKAGYRKFMYFTLSFVIIVKILVIELSIIL